MWLRARIRALPRAGIFFAVYFGVFVYPPWRLIGLLQPEWQLSTAVMLVLVLLPSGGYLTYQAYPAWLGQWALRVAFNWVGVCFVLLCLVVPFELLRLLVPMDPQTWGVVLLVVLAVLLALGVVNAQVLRVAVVPISSSNLKTPLRVAQISDLHIGSRLPGFLDRVVARVEALEPDLVCITGDLVDMRGLPRDVLQPLGRLSAPAVFAIGNHERYVHCQQVCDQVAATGARVLRNQSVEILGLTVLGIDDADAGDTVKRRLEELPRSGEGFELLLYHRPDGVRDASEAGVDLMLCGHTHAGQIAPFGYLVKRHYPLISGLFEVGAMHLYVSQGTGTWGPTLRLGSHNEITLLELTPAT